MPFSLQHLNYMEVKKEKLFRASPVQYAYFRTSICLHYSSIGWDNGLAPNRQQAIIWTDSLTHIWGIKGEMSWKSWAKPSYHYQLPTYISWPYLHLQSTACNQLTGKNDKVTTTTVWPKQTAGLSLNGYLPAISTSCKVIPSNPGQKHGMNRIVIRIWNEKK